MTDPHTGRNLVMAALTAVLIGVDAALAAIAVMVWSAHRDGNLTTAEAANFAVLGVSSAAGIVILSLALVALVRAGRGHRLSRAAAGLAWLRLAAVIIAVPIIALQLGAAAITELFPASGAVFAVTDALIAVIVTGAARRRTQPH